MAIAALLSGRNMAGTGMRSSRCTLARAMVWKLPLPPGR
jgi:hypothetical protein